MHNSYFFFDTVVGYEEIEAPERLGTRLKKAEKKAATELEKEKEGVITRTKIKVERYFEKHPEHVLYVKVGIGIVVALILLRLLKPILSKPRRSKKKGPDWRDYDRKVR